MLWSSLANANTFMPPAGTEIAERVNTLYAFFLWASLVSCILLIGGTIVFAIKYRRKSESEKTPYLSHNTILEFTWSFVPFLIFLVLFGWGWWVYRDMRNMPEDALEIHVMAQKWAWNFQYKSGKKSMGELYVPAGRPVKLIMTSRDVLHSFFVPAFRVKQDVVPGTYMAVWFEARTPGDYQIFCTEYCGDMHSSMLAKMHVVPEKEFESWLLGQPLGEGAEEIPMAEIGAKIFQNQCSVCHNPTEEKKIGPGLANVFGKTRKFADGSQVEADENYIRESILNPTAKVVEGFSPQMPPFGGLLSEQELAGVIEYIKSLSSK